MIVVEQLAAELEIELTAKFIDALANFPALQFNIFFVIKADLSHS